MKRLYSLEKEFNSENTDKEFSNLVCVGSLLDAFSSRKAELSRGKIEVIMTESDFSKVGSLVLNPLKSCGIQPLLLLIEENDFHYTSVKKSFSTGLSGVIAVGDKNLLSFVRYYASLSDIPCYALPTTPYFESISSNNVYLKTGGLLAVMPAKPYKNVFIDEAVIVKAENKHFSKAYISVMSKLTALIDYKIDCFLSGNKVDAELFSTVKKAINTLATITAYENYKTAIIGAELLILSINFNSPFSGSGVWVIKNALSLFSKKLSGGDKTLIAFEKTAKIYHMLFSNDFSDLLSVPDYEGDLLTLEEYSGYERAHFYKNLKIPSEKRIKLINLLLDKTRDDFKKETAVILSALPSVIKIYSQLNGKNRQTISYKQTKNAVNLGSYLTDRTSALTLCRDLGILKCAN